MKVKQQKAINTFLIEEFGKDRGNALFARQEKALAALIEGEDGRSQSQVKTLTQRIFPCIALYKALFEDGFSKDDGYEYTRKYMLNKVARSKHSSTAKMELIPGFYRIYSNVFLKVMRTADLWESTQKHGRASFDVTINKCLWHTACMENDCAELCRLFCDADNVTYDGLKKIGFTRTKTLGYGGDCCDFHFFKKG